MAAWAIFGCRTAFAPEVAEIAWRCGDEVAALVDNRPDGTSLAWTGGLPVLSADALTPEQLGLAAVVPQTTPGHRYAVAADAIACGFADFPVLQDPSAVVARTSSAGRGTIVGAGAVVAALAVLGEFVLVNRSASVGHHARVEDFASLGPGCVLAGGVTVRRGAFVGAGAVCAPGVTIGSNATVGAGAVVVSDVEDGDVVVGNPSRVVRSGTVGMNGVGVP